MHKNYHALTCLPCARDYVLSALCTLERWGNGVSERWNNLSKATEEIMGWGFGTGCREQVGWRRLCGKLQEKGCLKLWEERVVWEQNERIGLKWKGVSQVSHGCFCSPVCPFSSTCTVYWQLTVCRGFSGGSSGKEPACQCRWCKRQGFDSWVGKIHWRRKWQPTPVILPGKPHEQRNLAGCSPWGQKELDAT